MINFKKKLFKPSADIAGLVKQEEKKWWVKQWL
jgi:hypothetical protein